MRGTTAVPLARTLDELAALATIRGDAAEAALFSAGSAFARSRGIQTDAALGPIASAPPDANGLDPELHRRFRHMYDAGAWVLVESAIADLPADLRWLFESGAVTVDQLASLHAALGAVTAADLADAVERQAVRTVPGLDAAVEFAVSNALKDLRGAIPRVPLGRATMIVDPIIAALAAHGIGGATAVGSLRRGRETVGDVELVAPVEDPRPAVDELAALPGVVRVLHRSERRLFLRMERAQVGVRFPALDAAGALILHHTGSAAHIDALRQLTHTLGARLTAQGLTMSDGRVIAASEDAIYKALGLPVIPPEIRETGEEVRIAREGGLPRLLTASDIRGDLHMHTRFSDGRDTVAALVAAADALGYEYIAITDHSPTSAAAHSLTLDGVARQADEIAAAREAHPRVTVLHGCEVDILADGRLDFPDRVLARFDIVLASLHERVGHDGDRLLARYLDAIRHPLVNLITHPTNRLVPFRPAYDLDYDRLFEAAISHHTLVEIDGAPVHLDLDGTLARQAVAAGALLAVDSDTHRADQLKRQMGFAVATARRGWIEPRHVINTQPVEVVRAHVARKRGG